MLVPEDDPEEAREIDELRWIVKKELLIPMGVPAGLHHDTH